LEFSGKLCTSFHRKTVKSLSIFTAVWWRFVGAVFDLEASSAPEMRSALQHEVWRHNNRSIAAATSPQLLVYDTSVDMSRQFQLSKTRMCFRLHSGDQSICAERKTNVSGAEHLERESRK